MGIINKVGYTTKTFGKLDKYKLREDIIKSVEYNPELNKEMSRILHTANLRVQAIENASLASPSVEGMERKNGNKFAVFSLAGKSWEERKLEYGRAVAFLRQPTSTISGAREYKSYIQAAYDITDAEYDYVVKDIHGASAGAVAQRFLDDYVYRYKDFTGELERTAQDIASKIESEAEEIAQAIQKEIEKQADAIAEATAQAAYDIQHVFS